METDEQSYFGTVDYFIVAITLLLSSIIGVYIVYKSRKNPLLDEYLLANKSISWFPLVLSLVASYFSTVEVMGIVTKVYESGLVIGLSVFAFIIPIILSAEVFTPLFRTLQVTSINEVWKFIIINIVIIVRSL